VRKIFKLLALFLSQTPIWQHC